MKTERSGLGMLKKSLLTATCIASIGLVTVVPAMSPGPAYGYSYTDLEALKKTNKCRHCNLYGADLSNQDLSNADLSDASLYGANLSG
ncbi:MAG: pentapeptide repeat-containing protein, partial [Candidatus Brocadiales bacterium]